MRVLSNKVIFECSVTNDMLNGSNNILFGTCDCIEVHINVIEKLLISMDVYPFSSIFMRMSKNFGELISCFSVKFSNILKFQSM